MLTCREIERLLDLCIDQELDPLTREKCEQHLHRCSRCRALLQSKEEAAEVIRSCFPEPELPPEFSRGVIDKLSARQESIPHRRGILRKPWIAPVIAAALLVFVAFEAYTTDLLPLSTQEKGETIEPYFQDDGTTAYIEPQSQNDIDTSDSKTLSSPTPDFTPGYLPPGFTQESASVPGYTGEEGTPQESTVYSYHNPQTGASINLEITRIDYDKTSAEKERTAGAGYVSFFAERNGKHYLIRISGDLSSEELKKVANSIK